MILADLENIFGEQVAAGADNLFYLLVDNSESPKINTKVMMCDRTDLKSVLPTLEGFQYHSTTNQTPRFVK